LQWSLFRQELITLSTKIYDYINHNIGGWVQNVFLHNFSIHIDLDTASCTHYNILQFYKIPWLFRESEIAAYALKHELCFISVAIAKMNTILEQSDYKLMFFFWDDDGWNRKVRGYNNM
ncbi:hypothetical protein ACJX0J_028967, partial [Zea mays]